MVVVVLVDEPNYVYCLQKRTTGPETIEQRFSNSWAGTFDRNSKIIKGLHYIFYFYSNWFPGKLPRVICFIPAELVGDKIIVPEELHLDNEWIFSL